MIGPGGFLRDKTQFEPNIHCDYPEKAMSRIISLDSLRRVRPVQGCFNPTLLHEDDIVCPWDTVYTRSSGMFRKGERMKQCPVSFCHFRGAERRG